MYLFSALHGHETSSTPSVSGMPTECTHGTNSPSEPSASKAPLPMRVMIRMFATTHAESVISTPMWAIGEPIGPMENGTTYIILPSRQPSNRPLSLARMSAGSVQLFVGPASCSSAEQMNVRSSTRATSPRSQRAGEEVGGLASGGFRE